MKLINLTSHPINEVTTGTTIEPSGRVARVKQSTYKVAEHAGVPVYATKFNGVEGIPEPQPDTIYIVSALVLNATDRKDIVAPGNVQRNQNGDRIGCVGFRQNI